MITLWDRCERRLIGVLGVFALLIGVYQIAGRYISPRLAVPWANEAGVYVWDGNYYALAVTERLGLEESGGMVRVGPAHYNTVAEVERLGVALGKIARGYIQSRVTFRCAAAGASAQRIHGFHSTSCRVAGPRRRYPHPGLANGSHGRSH